MFEQVHQWNVEHIALATWADAYVVVPATANVIGKIYAGIADDMLTTTIMATKAPKYLCPAMNTEMYNNPITQRNFGRFTFSWLPYYGTCGRMACLWGYRCWAFTRA